MKNSLYASHALRVAGILSLTGFLFLARFAYHQYRAVQYDFEPAPASVLAKHPGQAAIAGLEEVSFRSQDGIRLAGWYVPSKNRAAVVVTHGTNADRASMLAETSILANAGFGVLAFDWPGDGGSEGSVHWDARERNALTAAINWLLVRTDVDPDKLGGFGFSMGGYVMAQVASQDMHLSAVVLAAAPTDFAEYTHLVHQRWGPLSELAADWALRRSGMPISEMRPVAVVHRIAPRPLLILGGSADPVIPEAMTRRLFASASAPKSLWIVPGAHHGDYAIVASDEYRRQLVDFFSRNLHVQ